MADVWLTNTGTGLVPSTAMDSAELGTIKLGDQVKAKITRPRNVLFHRKFFAMLWVGFEAFEPAITEHKGFPVQKNFKRFRSDVIIAAGFYEFTTDINGELRAVAKSISFARMDEAEFQQVYSKTADVLLGRVLKNYTRDDLDQVVDKMLNFC